MIRDLIREKADDLNDKILNAQTTSKNKSFRRMGGESCGSLICVALATPAVAFAASQIKNSIEGFEFLDMPLLLLNKKIMEN